MNAQSAVTHHELSQGAIEGPADRTELEALKAWHLKTLLTFKEVFTPEIQRVPEGKMNINFQPNTLYEMGKR